MDKGVEKVVADLATSLMLSVVVLTVVLYTVSSSLPSVTVENFDAFSLGLNYVFMFVFAATYFVVKDYKKK